jgi:hypothetical protein
MKKLEQEAHAESEFDLEAWIDADIEPYLNRKLSKCDLRGIACRAYFKGVEHSTKKEEPMPEVEVGDVIECEDKRKVVVEVSSGFVDFQNLRTVDFNSNSRTWYTANFFDIENLKLYRNGSLIWRKV